MFTATAITAGLIAGAVTIGSALEGDKPLRTSADAVIAQEVEPSRPPVRSTTRRPPR
ncbi:hypothetical protein ACFQ1I_37730 [Kitasatospora arboriphila]